MTSGYVKKVCRDRIIRVSIGIVILILLTTGSVLGIGFRIPVTIGTDSFERFEKPVDIEINFTQLVGSLGQVGTIDERSIRVYETNNIWTVIDTSVPYQFDKGIGYDTTNNAYGTVVFIMKGTTLPNTNRYYYVYFDMIGGSSSPVVTLSQVTLIDNVMDQGQSSFRVDITNSTFFFQKEAGGFSSWDDKNGNDWISWNNANGSAGKYRGVPNAVNPEEVFHPGFYCCTSTVVSQGPIKIRIKSVNGTKWESIWDFYPRYATMTMKKADHNYWFLYEGTPGGVLEKNKDFMVRSNGVKTFLNKTWKGDILGDEWAYFSDPSVGENGRSLFVTHHERDILQDLYWSHTYMTVFGFGRNETNLQKLLSTVPQRFTIGLVDGTDFVQNSKLINSAYKDLIITIDTVEQYNDGDIGPLLMVSSSPTNDPSTTIGTVQIFSTVFNKNADVTWYIDGSVVRTDTDVMASSYSNSTAGIGTHISRVVAINGTDTVSITWVWTVSSNIVSGDVRLTNNAAQDRQPVWSVDGTEIAFISNRDGGWGIYKMKSDGSFVTKLNHSGSSLEPSWYPVNKILFSIAIPGKEDIYVMSADGTNPSQLTNAVGFDEYPDWSPDGSKIVYSSAGGVINGARKLWVMNADGSSKRKLNSNTAWEIQPAWSPDGTKIAFKCYLGGTNICTMNANGTDIKRLTFNTNNTHDPDWNPDGSKIVYASVQDGDWEIYTMNSDGTGKKQMTSNIGFEDNYPAWSPDGRYIAYASNRSGNQEIWVMGVDGQSIPQVLSMTSSSPVTDPSTVVGIVQTFGIVLNKNADITWYVNGSVVKTETDVTTSSYSSPTMSIGTHVVNATAKNGTDIKSREWRWIVQDIVPGITVVSPNGKENWINGTTKTINWSYSGSSGPSVQIELLKGGIQDSMIIGNTPIGNSGIGSYSWQVPSNQVLGNDYKIRVTDTSNSLYNDTSNNNFSISSGTMTTVKLTIAIKQGLGNVEVFRNDSGSWTSLGSTTTSKIYTVIKGVQLKILATSDTGYIFERYVTNTGANVTINPIVANQNWAGSLDTYFKSY